MRFLCLLASLIFFSSVTNAKNLGIDQIPSKSDEKTIGINLPVNEFIPASTLPDLSGISWVCEDLFLAVHDTKIYESGPRLSFLKISSGYKGLLWKPLNVKFPKYDSSDLESIARIPASNSFLLVESTEILKHDPRSCRIFLSELTGEGLEIIDETRWPTETRNIEGTAVARLGEKYYFVFAERGHGEPDTEMKMSEIHFYPLTIESPKNMGKYKSPYPTGKIARPISAIEIDSSGFIYVASAEDPDDDNGPFASAIYRIGKITQDKNEARIFLDEKPCRLAVLDGLKVEGIAVREIPGKPVELFAGIDDENYGGTLRPIRLK